MTWNTWATDGFRIGSLEYLSDFWHEPYESNKYHRMPARISAIDDVPGNASWLTYEITSECGTACFNLRKDLNLFLLHYFDVFEVRSLVGKVVAGYYLDKTLKAIGLAESKSK